MAPPKSALWTFFTKIDKETCKCIVCFKHIKYSGNTSNMAKHLKINHPGKFNAQEKKLRLNILTSKGSSTLETSVSIPGTSTPPNTSTIPNTSVIPSTSTTTTINEYDADGSSTSSTKQLLKSDNTIAYYFKNIESLKEGGQKHAIITNAILFFICKDNRPFHLVSGEGFKCLMDKIAPGYKLPSEKTLKKLLEEKYILFEEIYKKKFSEINYFSVTCDVWSESMSMRSFLGVTIHYIHIQGISMESKALAVEELSERHTGKYLGETLANILIKWNIPLEKITTVVTDNGANMVAAINSVEGLGKAKHIPCFAHTINLVAETVTKNPSISGLIGKIREVVKWVKNSVVVSDQIRHIQREKGIEEGNIKKLIMDVKTRWNSVFYMIERYLEMQDMVNLILLKTPKSPNILTASESEVARQLVLLLKPLEFMTKECSGEKYITVSNIIPMLFCSFQQLNSITTEDDNIHLCKAALIAEMNRRFGQIEACTPIALATLLDPRFKNLHFQNAVACGTAITRLRNLVSNENVSEEDSSPEPVEPNIDYSHQFWRHHTEIAHGPHGKKKRKTRHEVEDEVAIYLRNPVAPLKSNVLEMWEDMKTIFPNLYKLSKKYLAITATSVPAERLFSKAGATFCRDRNRLLGKRASKIIFLGSCSKQEWNV